MTFITSEFRSGDWIWCCPINQQADFGLSLQLVPKSDFENKESKIVGDFPGKTMKELKLVCGTPSYMAPEILQRQPYVYLCVAYRFILQWEHTLSMHLHLSGTTAALRMYGAWVCCCSPRWQDSFRSKGRYGDVRDNLMHSWTLLALNL